MHSYPSLRFGALGTALVRRFTICAATLLLALAVVPGFGVNPVAAAQPPSLACWPVQRTDHPRVTVNNTSALSVVTARTVRTFGVDHCRYVPINASDAATPEPTGKELARSFSIEATLHNATARTISVDAGCRLYDANGGGLHPLATIVFTSVRPGTSVHLTTCEFDARKTMADYQSLPTEWARLSHAVLYIRESHNG